MNRQFRIVSALMRSVWLIEPTFAEAHLPFIKSYLAGEFSPTLLAHEDDEPESDPDPLARIGYALASSQSNPKDSPAPTTRYSLEDPNLPDGSVFVLDIRGAIFKESTCCSIGTEEYCQLLDAAYANEKIIGIVCLIDSPGGQLSGTPTLYDAIRNPQKPTVSVINEGMMASAAYWLACGSDDIYATQKSDQVGSIGVYVQFDDATERKKQMGIITRTIYSDRSSQKNKPFRDALAGDERLLKEDLNQAADLFREAVEQGRGARIKPTKKGGPDVFEGGLFYASQAIDLGLIDGFGNLTTAVNRVVELHQARQANQAPPAPTGGFALTETAPESIISTIIDAPTSSSTAAAVSSDPSPVATQTVAETPTESPTPNPHEPMFGFTKLPALAALKGVAAADVTDEQIAAVNAEFASEGYSVALISQAQFTAAQTLQTQLATATSTIATRDEEITRLGKQPGVMGTKVEKTEETIAEPAEAIISETDAELARLKGKAV